MYMYINICVYMSMYITCPGPRGRPPHICIGLTLGEREREREREREIDVYVYIFHYVYIACLPARAFGRRRGDPLRLAAEDVYICGCIYIYEYVYVYIYIYIHCIIYR